jgi:hypothetical protein
MPPLALSDSVKELLVIVFIVLVPTVPATIYVWTLLERRRERGSEVASGRSPETPFAVITYVGTAIAVVAVLTLLLVVAVRAAAT